MAKRANDPAVNAHDIPRIRPRCLPRWLNARGEDPFLIPRRVSPLIVFALLFAAKQRPSCIMCRDEIHFPSVRNLDKRSRDHRVHACYFMLISVMDEVPDIAKKLSDLEHSHMRSARE